MVIPATRHLLEALIEVIFDYLTITTGTLLLIIVHEFRLASTVIFIIASSDLRSCRQKLFDGANVLRIFRLMAFFGTSDIV